MEVVGKSKPNPITANQSGNVNFYLKKTKKNVLLLHEHQTGKKSLRV